MENNCLNCSRPITENFCSNCGQKKYKRIDRKYLIDEVQYLAVHTNKGFFYSIKNVARNPGKTAKNLSMVIGLIIINPFYSPLY